MLRQYTPINLQSLAIQNKLLPLPSQVEMNHGLGFVPGVTTTFPIGANQRKYESKIFKMVTCDGVSMVKAWACRSATVSNHGRTKMLVKAFVSICKMWICALCGEHVGQVRYSRERV